LSRGKTLTLGDLRRWIDELDVSDGVKERLRALRPSDYIGLAATVCDAVVERARTWLGGSGSG
jgi:hypothetical protein